MNVELFRDIVKGTFVPSRVPRFPTENPRRSRVAISAAGCSVGEDREKDV